MYTCTMQIPSMSELQARQISCCDQRNIMKPPSVVRVHINTEYANHELMLGCTTLEMCVILRGEDHK